ncbi:hypothetical protein NCC49_000347 [Naganishia albida]|nr:hypothetical protein NCC49_000347 [Naganishia albida]
MDAGPTLPSLLLEAYHDAHAHNPPPDLTAKQSTEYLTRLTGYSLNSLTSEPSRIADEHAFVGRELTSLCIGEYKSFVAVHQCKDQVRTALDEFDASLEELRRAIPELERECAVFVQETSGIQAERRRAQIVLEHQDKLVDLLDIPQLVDTCVRNGYYHEAMELTSHTRQLVERHPDVPLVKAISTQVDAIMQLQLSQLVASLREPVKLPVLVKSIGFLRKMASLEEDELRLAFLESRAQRWRDHLKEHVDKERYDPTRYVRRYVDAFRELQYDTVVQYTAIFLDPAPFRNSSRRSNAPAAATAAAAAATGMDDASRAQALDLIVRYAHHAVADLLHCITTYLPAITDPSSLSSLLTQLGYTALSFSRVGMDFSASLPEVFERAVQELTVSGWEEGRRQVMERLRPTGMTTAQRNVSPSGQSDIEAVFLPGFLVSPAGLSALTRAEPPTFVPPVHKLPDSITVPPLYLTSYPLLATYTNSLVTTLNSLRLLAPVALLPTLYSSLLDNLSTFGQALLEYATHATGQSDPALAPARKRPEGLRRNTSISNRDQLAERTQARERHGKRILSAVLDAYATGCVPFLRGALVDGVYAGRGEGLKRGGVARSEERLDTVVQSLRYWVARHAEEGEKKTEPPKGIAEEEATAEKAAGNVLEEEDNKPPSEASDAIITASGVEVDATKGSRHNAQMPALTHDESVVTLDPVPHPQQTQDEDDVPEETALVVQSGTDIAESPQPSVAPPADDAPVETTGPAPAEVTADPPRPSTPNVIEQVLEIGIADRDDPIAASDPGEIAASSSSQAIPVQITEEVQLPVQDSTASSLDGAAPVFVVPDTSTERLPTEGEVTVTPKVNADDDIVDRLIAAKQEAEAASGRTEAGERKEEHPHKDESPETEQSEKPEPTADSAALELPTSLDSATAPVDEFEKTKAAVVSPELPSAVDAASAVVTTDAAHEPTVQASAARNGYRVEPDISTSDRPETSAELAASEEDVPSGAVTPNEEEEVETAALPSAPDTQRNSENAGGKSKKKKNKKKGKK